MTTNRVYKTPQNFQSQKSSKYEDNYQQNQNQNNNFDENAALQQSMKSKYKNVLIELQRLQEAHEGKCKELSLSNN